MEVARDTNKGKRNQGVKTAKEFEIFSMCVLSLSVMSDSL